MAFILLPLSTALTTPIDFRAARRDQLPVGREILVQEALDAIADVGRLRAHVGGKPHHDERSLGERRSDRQRLE